MRPLRLARDLSATMIAGAAAGVLAFGVGGRLAMRLAAWLSAPHLQGIATSERAIVGAITWSGTLQILVIGAMVGLIGAPLYLLAKPALGERARGTKLALVVFFVSGASLIDAGNSDFRVFGRPAINVIAFAALPFAYGPLLVRFEADLRARLPERPLMLALHAPVLALAAILGIMGPFLMAEDHPLVAWAIGALLLAGIAMRAPVVGRAARPAIALPCVLGAVAVAVAVAAVV